MNKFTHSNPPRRVWAEVDLEAIRGKIGDVLDIFSFRNP